MDSARGREQRPSVIHNDASFDVAVWTWQMVRSGVFFFVLLAELGKEQVADTTKDQVPADRLELAHLEVVHAQLPFAVLEHAFDLPATECDKQQRFDRISGGAFNSFGKL